MEELQLLSLKYFTNISKLDKYFLKMKEIKVPTIEMLNWIFKNCIFYICKRSARSFTDLNPSLGDRHRRWQRQTREHRVLPHRAGHRHWQARPEQVRHQQDDGRDICAEGAYHLSSKRGRGTEVIMMMGGDGNAMIICVLYHPPSSGHH